MKRLAVTVVLAMGISFPILADAPPVGKVTTSLFTTPKQHHDRNSIEAFQIMGCGPSEELGVSKL
jgi:hypothetical protein